MRAQIELPGDVAAELAGRTLAPPPVETALGALLHHITGAAIAET